MNNNNLGLKSLITITELVSNQKLTRNIQLSPHFIDYSTCIVYYETKVSSSDLIALLNSLKSMTPISRVESRGVDSLNLEGIMSLFEILSIRNSVIDLDVSPHLINISKRSFCFSPSRSIPISVEDSSLNSLVKLPNLKEVTIKNCRFSPSSITVLCDLIQVSDSLTSIDFSNCGLTDDCF
ncbi:hypothetical protein GEMRC1_007685 [Eukaryota sp. GEM-RC1]